MSLRVRSVMELPESLRAGVQALIDVTNKQKQPAAKELAAAMWKAEREKLVLALLKQLEYANLGCLFTREYVFHPERKWALDLFSHGYRLGIEVHGGISEAKRGRHLRARGFTRDREKMNAALECGIRVLEYTAQHIADGSAVDQIKRIVEAS